MGIAARMLQCLHPRLGFVQQFLCRIQSLQAAHGFGGMQQAGSDAARPAGGACQFQRALHLFQCRLMVAQAAQVFAQIGGGNDGGADLAGMQCGLMRLDEMQRGAAIVVLA